ncbi:MAG: ABC transporter substrate-binding protein [Methanocellales archaeon]|nr:ABC transporter substrate-binding protein [Methanocellales archaeon]MDD3291966.1 ABC transporter substrate-binding protein [Methanocellales archaeon]MDD5235632.1 ABC transporter substrate-binding protein [Methanocellales archaeon]MDD5485479.1 ABC transporter substrate-binding protein [Methanocellales archaeon]
MSIKIGLIRGICQMPGYVAYEKGFFKDQGLDISCSVDPTAWILADKLISGEISFGIVPWTRVVSARDKGDNLIVIAGSGYEETATVVRRDANINSLSELKGKRISLPVEGGMKDLTSQALFKKYGITPKNTEILRLPSGDAAILAMLSGRVDATTNVEPYATMAVELGIGKIIARGKDILPKVPGCSLTTTDHFLRDHPDIVLKFIKAILKAEEFCHEEQEEAAKISSKYIGISSEIVREALRYNQPHTDITGSIEVMTGIVRLMKELGYIESISKEFYDFELLKEAKAELE